MKTKNKSALGFILGAIVVCPPALFGQAPPGPMPPAKTISESTAAKISAEAPKPKRKENMTIVGAWELNRDESDDARKKMQDARGSSGGSGSGGGYPGGGRRGGGYPGGGGSRGGIGGRGGYGGQRGQSDEDRRRMEELFRPARMLTIERKETEVDMTDDLDQRKIFYTDGRKLQKPKKDETQTEFSAKWEGDRLVSEGKDSRGDKITRTFELAREGESLYEILYIERSSNNGTYIRYVYDRSSEEKRPGH